MELYHLLIAIGLYLLGMATGIFAVQTIREKNDKPCDCMEAEAYDKGFGDGLDWCNK